MARRLVLFLALGVLLGATAARAETYGAVLTGAQETPPNNSTGFGNATVTLDAARTSVNVKLTFSSLTAAIIGAHIHGEAPAGVATGVVIPFTTDAASGRMDKTFTIDKTLGDKIAANPHLYYVNVHTPMFPGGEIRGQLTLLDDVTKFSAELRGVNEVPPSNSTVVGAALVTIDAANALTFEVSTPGIVSPIASHIHGPNGPAGVVENVLIGFTSSTNTFSGGRLKGSVQISAANAAAIRANPANFYVNVHTTANPGGEVRGQLVAANESDVGVAGKVTGARGENFVTDVRIFNPSFTNRTSTLVEYFAAGTTANTNATASFAVDLPPRGMGVLDDVAGSSALNSPGTTGGIRVTSASQIVVSSRIFDDRRPNGGGTIGQFVPGVPRANGLRRGVMAQLANNSFFRTNVGFFNPTINTVNVRLEVRDAAGAVLGMGTVDMPALSQTQRAITAYFPSANLADRGALSVSFDASAPVVGYASVVDNVSADQIFVSAQEDPGVSAP